MRELRTNELEFVSGGLVCTQGEGGNVLYGISRPDRFGDFMIDLYEGAIQGTSYMIERVANAF